METAPNRLQHQFFSWSELDPPLPLAYAYDEDFFQSVVTMGLGVADSL